MCFDTFAAEQKVVILFEVVEKFTLKFPEKLSSRVFEKYADCSETSCIMTITPKLNISLHTTTI